MSRGACESPSDSVVLTVVVATGTKVPCVAERGWRGCGGLGLCLASSRDPHSAPPAPPAQPVLYWCARNMSFWSSISFNLAVLMNLLVAFFYPFSGVRGGGTAFSPGGAGSAAVVTPGSAQTGPGGGFSRRCGLPSSIK